MSAIRVEIDPGQCGFNATVDATFDPAAGVCHIALDTRCPNLREFAKSLTEVRPAEEACWDKSAVHSLMRGTCQHTACPVPVGVIKAIQVAAGFKRPVDSHIRFVEKAD